MAAYLVSFRFFPNPGLAIHRTRGAGTETDGVDVGVDPRRRGRARGRRDGGE